MKFMFSRLKYLMNYENNNSVVTKLRAKRIAPLLLIIKEFHRRHGYVDLIDIGGTTNYWRIVPSAFLKKYKVQITILNLTENEHRGHHSNFKYIVGDGCNLHEIPNNRYHIAHSNSVIEHVGGWDRMVAFAHHISRIAISYYVQTPNYWFPIEPHFMLPFFHWIPRSQRAVLLTNFNIFNRKKTRNLIEAYSSIDSSRLLTKNQLKTLFKDSAILEESFFLMPKSLVAIRGPSFKGSP